VNIANAIDNVENFTFTGTGNWSAKGNALDNVFTGGAGNDTIDGGAGNDTVIFTGKSSDYQIVYSEGQAFVVDLNAADGNDGVDGLRNVEHAQFSDITVDLAAQSQINGVAAGDLAGRSVATAGDINNDGFDDFIIGASGAKGAAGAAYVVFGGADGLPSTLELSGLNGSNGFKLSGVSAKDAAGFSVSGAGDINKDGFDDFIVGSLRGDGSVKDSGAAYVVFGHGGAFNANIDLGKLNGSDGFKLSGAALNDFAGASVHAAGDINGDGYADIVVGAEAADSNGSDAGTAYVVFGHGGNFTSNIDLSALDGTTGFALTGRLAFDRNGWSVSSAGDVNGDGIDDLLVGAVAAGSQNAYTGEAYVVFGHSGSFSPTLNVSGLNGSNGFAIKGQANYDGVGYSVASAGDINGDGYADLIVGAPYSDQPGKDAGSAYVVFGHGGSFSSTLSLAGLNGTNGFKIEGLQAGDYTGLSVSSAGDVNGDGIDDLIIGAPDAGSQYDGAAYILFGSTNGFSASVDLQNLNAEQGFWVFGSQSGDSTGLSVSAAGDIDGDGYADLLIGSPFADPHGKSSGSVEIIYGADLLGMGKATAKADVLTGTSGPDTLRGFGGDDTLIGLAADDILNGGTGNDLMKGGSGNDTYFVDSAGDTIDEEGNSDTGDTVNASVSVDLVTLGGGKIENAILSGTGALDVLGNAKDNHLTGNAAANILNGGDGADVIVGGGGSDKIDAGAQDDSIVIGDLWFASIDGGAGIDTLTLSGAGMRLLASRIGDGSITGIENFVLAGEGSGIEISLAALQAEAPGVTQFMVSTTEGGLIWIGDEFTKGAHQTVDGNDYTAYTASGVTVLVESSITLPPPAQPIATLNLAALDGTNGFKVDAANTFDGMAVAGAGDLNNDGFDDFVVGSFYGTLPSDPSKLVSAYVIYGGKDGFPASFDPSKLDGSDGYVITGVAAYKNSIASSGDFNGDGINDIVISSTYGGPSAPANAGVVYVVYGTDQGVSEIDLSALNGSNGFKLTSSTARAFLGNSSSIADDINGDGFDDLVTTAPNYGNGLDGVTYVLFGHGGGSAATLSLSAASGAGGFKIVSPDGGHFGASVATLDFNADGFADILISSNNDQAAAVVFGHSGGFGTIDLSKLDGTNGFLLGGFNGLGRTLGSVGDINGDGYDDFMVGASLNGGFVVFGHGGSFSSEFDVTSLDGSNGFKLVGLSGLSLSVSSAGDVNGDGIDDLIVGSNAGSAGQLGTSTGDAYVLFGSRYGFNSLIDLSAITPSQGFKIEGAHVGDSAASAVAAAGDVNGDGFDDLMIAAPYAHTGANVTGAGYIVFGGNFTGAVTHLGGDSDDTLQGTAGADDIVGAAGNDVIYGNGGHDVLKGGAGNDVLYVSDGNFRHIDGGGGSDALHFDFGGVIDFANLDGNSATVDRGKIEGIEALDFANGLINTINLHVADAVDLNVENQDFRGIAKYDNVLEIDGDAGDKLQLSKADGWSAGDKISVVGFTIYTSHDVTIAVDADVTVTLT
jgi:Ca2+-binding RTX toxin-like protein